MTRRTRCISRTLNIPEAERGWIESRIKTTEATIAHLKAMPPAVGSKWRLGMIRYYEQCLQELIAYAADSGKAK